MNSASLPTFSFVIPAYNEAADIVDTLKSVWAQQYPTKEVIIIDDGSTDDTSAIVRDLKSREQNIILIEHAENRGLAAARNTGIKAATGDIVVFLDADDQPAPDFLQRLVPLYESGCDFVSVESRVMHDDLIGRYIQAEHEVVYGGGRWIGFSAAFSCRREAALDVLFPEELPGAGGEDVEFFKRLKNRGFASAADFSIVVGRRFPTSVRGFWKQWVGRGRPIPYVCRFVKGHTLPVVVVRRLLATGWQLAKMVAIVPAAIVAFRRSRKSPRRLRDAPAFWFLHHVQLTARRWGEWQSVFEMLRSRRPLRAGELSGDVQAGRTRGR